MKGVGFKVAVKCLTYNHAPYIEDAMNGFCIQQTSFPFVCCILDDASTDGEQEVIKRYLEKNFDLEDKEVVRTEETDDYHLIFSRHKTNCNCYFAVLLLKYNHYRKKSKDPYIQEWLSDAKYIALCEGDDYWVHSEKLERQVWFLESHPDFGLIHTNYYTRKGNEIYRLKGRNRTKFKQLLVSPSIGTHTTCFRTELFRNYQIDIQPSEKNWLMGDAPLWKYISYYSRIGFLSDYSSVYRVLENSASHSTVTEKRIEFINSGYDVQLFFINKFIDKPSQKNKYIYKSKRWKAESVVDAYLTHNEYDDAWLYFNQNKRYLSIKAVLRLLIKTIRHAF